jgi:hypothetical protein
VALGRIYLRELQFPMLLIIPGCSILIHHHATALTEWSIILSSPCQLRASSVCPGTWLIKVEELCISFYMSASRPACQHEHRNTHSLSRRLDMEQVYLSRCIGLPMSLMPEESRFDSWQEQAMFSLQLSASCDAHTTLYPVRVEVICLWV